MRRRAVVPLVLVVGLLMACSPMFAHHGNAAYDARLTVSLNATITSFEFVNPHAQVFFTTEDDKGNVTHWSCEATNPAMLDRVGWSKTTLQPGDKVTMVVHLNRKPGVTVVGLVKVILANGQVLESRNLV